MPRGGYQIGGGRPKGAKNKKTVEVIKRAESEGIMPRELLLSDMRYYYKLGEEKINEAKTKANINKTDIEEAVEIFRAGMSFKGIARDCAEKVAPYYHPKLSSVDAKVQISNQETALAELE